MNHVLPNWQHASQPRLGRIMVIQSLIGDKSCINATKSLEILLSFVESWIFKILSSTRLTTLQLIIFTCKHWLKSFQKKSYISWVKETFAMSYCNINLKVVFTPISWVLVIRNQIANSTLDHFFVHNSFFTFLNEKYKPIINI